MADYTTYPPPATRTDPASKIIDQGDRHSDSIFSDPTFLATIICCFPCMWLRSCSVVH